MGDPMPRGGAIRKGKIVNLRIQFLDDSVHAFQVPVKALGMALWEAVVRHLQLVESDYFDLQYGDKNGLKSWLDNEKPILKQLPSPDSPLEFCVKFYTPDPGLLDEFTRYLFSLQIKKDLATGSMQCSENTAALIASYIAQAEIGDFIVEEYLDHTYLKGMNPFVPHQTDELLKKVMEYHKQHIGESPAEAESSLLDTARKVDTYGVKLCPAKDHEGVALHLSIAHIGILVFQIGTKINTFSWAKVRKLSFKRRKFLIKLHPESYGYYKDTVEFFFESRDECKIFWKKCIEHHAFFRCHTVKKVARNKTRLVSRGSSFRYSGRTQKQLMAYVRETCVKSPAFERSVSGRISCSRSASVTPKISAKVGLHNSTADTHNSTASSGSHILSPGLDDQATPSRTETAEVHSVDSSLSGSRSLPSPKLDRSREGTPGDEMDHPAMEAASPAESRVDRLDERGASSTFVTNAIVSAPLDSNPSNNQNVSANQNANDNDKNNQSPASSLEIEGKLTEIESNVVSQSIPSHSTKSPITKEHAKSSGEVGKSNSVHVDSSHSLSIHESSPEFEGSLISQKSPGSTLGREHKKVVFADDVLPKHSNEEISAGDKQHCLEEETSAVKISDDSVSGSNNIIHSDMKRRGQETVEHFSNQIATEKIANQNTANTSGKLSNVDTSVKLTDRNSGEEAKNTERKLSLDDTSVKQLTEEKGISDNKTKQHPVAEAEETNTRNKTSQQVEKSSRGEVILSKGHGNIMKLELKTNNSEQNVLTKAGGNNDEYRNELNKGKDRNCVGINGEEDMIGDIPYLLHRRHMEKSPEPEKTGQATSADDIGDIMSNRRSRSLKKKRPTNMQVHQVKVYEGSFPVVPDKSKSETQKSPLSGGNSPISPASGGNSPCSDTSSLGSVVGSPLSPMSRGGSPISPGSRGNSPTGTLPSSMSRRSPSGNRGYQSRSPSGKRTPSRSSVERSPSCNRRMEIVNYHCLPRKDSFSCVDDTTSPTFEKEILTQIQNKENIQGKDSSFLECNGEVVKDTNVTQPVAKEPLGNHQMKDNSISKNNVEMLEDITVVDRNSQNEPVNSCVDGTVNISPCKESTRINVQQKTSGMKEPVQHSNALKPLEGDHSKLVSNRECVKKKIEGAAMAKTSSSEIEMRKGLDKNSSEKPTLALVTLKPHKSVVESKKENADLKTVEKATSDGKDNTSCLSKPVLLNKKPFVSSRKPDLPSKKPDLPSKKPDLPRKKPDLPSKKPDMSAKPMHGRKPDLSSVSQASLDFSSPAAEFILSETDYASKQNRNSITFSTFKPDSNSTSPRPLSLVSLEEEDSQSSISLAADKDPTLRLNQAFSTLPPENVFRPNPKPKLKLRRHPSDQSVGETTCPEQKKSFHKEQRYMYSFESVNDPPSGQMFISGSTDTDVKDSPESVDSVDMLESLENLVEHSSDESESSISEGSNSEFGDDSEHECYSSDNDDAERQKEFLQFAKSLADSGKEMTVDSGVGVELCDSVIKDVSPLDPLDKLEALEGSVYEDENQNIPPQNDNRVKQSYSTTLSSSSDESYHERVVRNKRVSVDPLESLENPHIAELVSLSGDSCSDCDSDDQVTSKTNFSTSIPILTLSTASSPDDPHRSPTSSHDNEISQSNSS